MTTDSGPHDPSLDITEDATPSSHDRTLDVLGSDEPRASPVQRVHPPEPTSQTRTRNGLAIAIVGLFLAGVGTWIVLGATQAGDTAEVKSALLVLATLAGPAVGYYFGSDTKR